MTDLQRLGIFGGSFDPVHYGHLLLAESCCEQCRLDQVWFLPAASAPHKQQHNTTDARHRVEMLRLAVGGHSRFQISTLEIDRGGVSYTADTLREIHAANPDAELFFLMGADSLVDLPHWRKPEHICELAVPVVVQRAGSAAPDYRVLEKYVSAERLNTFRRCLVTMPIIELTSTDIRQRAGSGRTIRFRTPRAVEKYIENHQLYQSPHDT